MGDSLISRKRKEHDEDNAILVEQRIPGNDPIVAIDSEFMKKSTGRDLRKVRYPLYLYFDHPRFNVEDFSELPSFVNPSALKELDLTSNNVAKIGSFLEAFVNLRRLYVARNAVSSVDTFVMPKLEELYLRGNQLRRSFVQLSVVDLSFNAIEGGFDNLSSCIHLRILDMSNNQLGANVAVAAFEEDIYYLQALRKLNDVDFRDNPIQNSCSNFRTFFISSICTRNLHQLDGTRVLKKERRDKQPKLVEEAHGEADNVQVEEDKAAKSEEVAPEATESPASIAEAKARNKREDKIAKAAEKARRKEVARELALEKAKEKERLRAKAKEKAEKDKGKDSKNEEKTKGKAKGKGKIMKKLGKDDKNGSKASIFDEVDSILDDSPFRMVGGKIPVDGTEGKKSNLRGEVADEGTDSSVDTVVSDSAVESDGEYGVQIIVETSRKDSNALQSDVAQNMRKPMPQLQRRLKRRGKVRLTEIYSSLSSAATLNSGVTTKFGTLVDSVIECKSEGVELGLDADLGEMGSLVSRILSQESPDVEELPRLMKDLIRLSIGEPLLGTEVLRALAMALRVDGKVISARMSDAISHSLQTDFFAAVDEAIVARVKGTGEFSEEQEATTLQMLLSLVEFKSQLFTSEFLAPILPVVFARARQLFLESTMGVKGEQNLGLLYVRCFERCSFDDEGGVVARLLMDNKLTQVLYKIIVDGIGRFKELEEEEESEMFVLAVRTASYAANASEEVADSLGATDLPDIALSFLEGQGRRDMTSMSQDESLGHVYGLIDLVSKIVVLWSLKNLTEMRYMYQMRRRVQKRWAATRTKGAHDTNAGPNSIHDSENEDEDEEDQDELGSPGVSDDAAGQAKRFLELLLFILSTTAAPPVLLTKAVSACAKTVTLLSEVEGLDLPRLLLDKASSSIYPLIGCFEPPRIQYLARLAGETGSISDLAQISNETVVVLFAAIIDFFISLQSLGAGGGSQTRELLSGLNAGDLFVRLLKVPSHMLRSRVIRNLVSSFQELNAPELTAVIECAAVELAMFGADLEQLAPIMTSVESIAVSSLESLRGTSPLLKSLRGVKGDGHVKGTSLILSLLREDKVQVLAGAVMAALLQNMRSRGASQLDAVCEFNESSVNVLLHISRDHNFLRNEESKAVFVDILAQEDIQGIPTRPLGLERCITPSLDVEALLSLLVVSLEKGRVKGPVAWRILRQLAELLEGPQGMADAEAFPVINKGDIGDDEVLWELRECWDDEQPMFVAEEVVAKFVHQDLLPPLLSVLLGSPIEEITEGRGEEEVAEDMEEREGEVHEPQMEAKPNVGGEEVVGEEVVGEEVVGEEEVGEEAVESIYSKSSGRLLDTVVDRSMSMRRIYENLDVKRRNTIRKSSSARSSSTSSPATRNAKNKSKVKGAKEVVVGGVGEEMQDEELGNRLLYHLEMEQSVNEAENEDDGEQHAAVLMRARREATVRLTEISGKQISDISYSDNFFRIVITLLNSKRSNVQEYVARVIMSEEGIQTLVRAVEVSGDTGFKIKTKVLVVVHRLLLRSRVRFSVVEEIVRLISRISSSLNTFVQNSGFERLSPLHIASVFYIASTLRFLLASTQNMSFYPADTANRRNIIQLNKASRSLLVRRLFSRSIEKLFSIFLSLVTYDPISELVKKRQRVRSDRDLITARDRAAKMVIESLSLALVMDEYQQYEYVLNLHLLENRCPHNKFEPSLKQSLIDRIEGATVMREASTSLISENVLSQEDMTVAGAFSPFSDVVIFCEKFKLNDSTMNIPPEFLIMATVNYLYICSSGDHWEHKFSVKIDDIESVTRKLGGQHVHIRFKEEGGGSVRNYIAATSPLYGVVDFFIDSLGWLDRQRKIKLSNDISPLKVLPSIPPKEAVFLLFELTKVNKRGSHQDRFIVMTSTQMLNYRQSKAKYTLRTKHAHGEIVAVETFARTLTQPRVLIRFNGKEYYDLLFSSRLQGVIFVRMLRKLVPNVVE